MALPKKLGSVKRFGARYGRRVKHKLAKIESVQRSRHKCPSCHSVKVRRVAVGIWNCAKCGAKFAGKAYTTGSRITSTKDIEEKKVEEVEDTEEEIQEEAKQEEPVKKESPKEEISEDEEPSKEEKTSEEKPEA